MDPLLYTLIDTDSHPAINTTGANPTMPYPGVRQPTTHATPSPFSPTNTITTSTSSTPSTISPPTPPHRLHRLYTDLPEHHHPTPTDPIIPHGSPLSSRLHRRLEGIRAAISREADLQSPPTTSSSSPTNTLARNHGAPLTGHRRGSHGSENSDIEAGTTGAGWSPSCEASEIEYVRRRDAQDGDDVKVWGWPGLGIFEDRSAGARMLGRRPSGKEEGWGWPGLGWVEYKPRK